MNTGIAKRMKRKIAILSAVVLSVFFLFGCGLKLPEFSEMPVKNGFIYLEQDGGITIMGIKAEAVDEDGIVMIPKTLKGKTVKMLGYTESGMIGAAEQGGFYYERDLDIKEIHIPSTVTDIDDHFMMYHTDFYFNFNKGFKTHSRNAYRRGNGDTSTYTYPIDLFEAYKVNDSLEVFLDHAGYNTLGRRIANVYYNANPNAAYEFYYWLDYIEGESKLRKPKVDPTRKGYTFTGWYREPECIHLWDFDSTIELTKMEPEDDYNDQVKYTNYLNSLENHTITLYAGWKK